MTILEIIIETYPELANPLPGVLDPFANKTIYIRDDSDGFGAYLAAWNYEKPIPDGLTLGKPTA